MEASNVTQQEALTAMARADRSDRPDVLFGLWSRNRIDRASLAAALPGVWAGAEWPAEPGAMILSDVPRAVAEAVA